MRIADKYITSTILFNQRMHSPIDLAATSLLIAAKLKESIAPSFENMSTLLAVAHKIKVTKQQFIDLEERILRQLEFEVQSVTPVAFLERYLRIFGLNCVN